MWQPGTEQGWVSCVPNLQPAMPEGKSRLGWALSHRKASQTQTTVMFDLQSS